ncbi:MAG: hypothetical protein ACOYYJ_18580 [Chloroflexota bacterium]
MRFLKITRPEQQVHMAGCQGQQSQHIHPKPGSKIEKARYSQENNGQAANALLNALGRSQKDGRLTGQCGEEQTQTQPKAQNQRQAIG